jgi:hypothetical protein
VFPQRSNETNALLFPMLVEFELDYEISFTIVANVGKVAICDGLHLSQGMRNQC